VTQRNILNSWKEIAIYMGRAVRTVQRWEEECHLPVHRPRGRKRSPVFALSNEIDQWLQECPVQTLEVESNSKETRGSGNDRSSPRHC
jgi:phage terminase Nu1 subunit (DNA packaging protein)